MDTASKPCQLRFLADMHAACEERIRLAHKNAAAAASHLEQCVRQCAGKAMTVNFVTAAQIAKKVTPATFSFNLPVPAHLEGDSVAAAALVSLPAPAMCERACVKVVYPPPCLNVDRL